MEYLVQYISVHQISTYSRVKPLSLYAEHILSTQFTTLSSLLVNLKSVAEYPVQTQNWCSVELHLFTVEMLQYQCLHFLLKDWILE